VTTTTAFQAVTTTSFPRANLDPSTTSCSRVAYIGDSVSLGMVVSEEVPDPPARLDIRLAAIGVRELRAEVSGGRSIVETLTGQENAHDVAVRLRSEGFTGCWVLAVGTNDAANIAAGGRRQATERITSMMSVIGTDPVLWLDAATVAVDGFWAAPNIAAWNDVLRAMAPNYLNLHVASWSTFVGPQWFQPDGVHLTDAGSIARVEFVASALGAAFPGR
jgi:lysophospholipase L1-like esterase